MHSEQKKRMITSDWETERNLKKVILSWVKVSKIWQMKERKYQERHTGVNAQSIWRAACCAMCGWIPELKGLCFRNKIK